MKKSKKLAKRDSYSSNKHNDQFEQTNEVSSIIASEQDTPDASIKLENPEEEQLVVYEQPDPQNTYQIDTDLFKFLRFVDKALFDNQEAAYSC